VAGVKPVNFSLLPEEGVYSIMEMYHNCFRINRNGGGRCDVSCEKKVSYEKRTFERRLENKKRAALMKTSEPLSF